MNSYDLTRKKMYDLLVKLHPKRNVSGPYENVRMRLSQILQQTIMSVLNSFTLLANGMIHSKTGLIGHANDEPEVQVLVSASRGLSAPKSEMKLKRVKQTIKERCFVYFFIAS